MAGIEPGERPGAPTPRPSRELERPPGERYAQGMTEAARQTTSRRKAGLVGPLSRAAVAAAVGAALLFVVGAVLASTAGLLVVAGLTGAAIGLLLARAAVAGPADGPALTRRQAARYAIALSIVAVVLGAVGTWLNARGEGGSLGLIDYLLETFGPFTPAEAAAAAFAAAWGAGAGPVER